MRFHRAKVLLAVLGCLCLASVVDAQTDSVTLSSPDNLIQAKFSIQAATSDSKGGQLVYEITYKGKQLLDKSDLGLYLQDQPDIGANLRIENSKPSKIDETYTVPAGKSNPVHNDCNVVDIDLTEAQRPFRKLTVEARAYNDGIAFRYLIPDEPRTKDIRIVNEKTQFVDCRGCHHVSADSKRLSKLLGR